MFGLADRAGNKIKVNSVWVMFWYHWTYMVAIGKKLRTNDKLKRWLTNPNRNFNETNEPRSALISQTRPPIKKTNIWQRQEKNIPKMALLSKLASWAKI